MASQFIIQVVYKKTGEVIKSWLPGERVEKDIEDEVIGRIQAKGVGFLKTEAKVLASVREALREFLYSLKEMV